jgi:hypothetical protein
VELEFFIKGLRSKKWLQERGCNYWSQWCNPKIVPYGNDPDTKAKMAAEDDLGPIYGVQWRNFRDPQSEDENGVSDSDEEDDDNDDGGGDDDESCIDSGGDYNRRGKGREHNNNYSLLRDKSHEKNDQKNKSDDNNNNNYSSNNSNSSTTMSSSCYNDWITDDMYAEMLKEITTIHERERKDY